MALIIKMNKRETKKTSKNLSRKRGIALFITLILSSVLLLISFAISNIALKEVLLSSSGRESQIAFYASNTGIECALYYALNVDGKFPIPHAGTNDIDCGQGPMQVENNGINEDGIDKAEYTFSFKVRDNSDSPCGQVTLKKWVEEDNGVNFEKVEIESRGWNLCEEDGDEFGPASSPRVLERALRVVYGGVVENPDGGEGGE